MTSEQVESLRHRLQAQTGIDFASYCTDELVESLGNLVRFPSTALRIIQRPIWLLGLAVLLLTVLFLWLGEFLLGLLFFPFGETVAVLNGLCIGMLLFVHAMTGDLRRVLQLSLDTVKRVLGNLEEVYRKAQRGEAQFPPVSEITLGVLYIVILPAVVQMLHNWGWLLGRPAAWLFTRIFQLATRRLVKQVQQVESAGASPDVDADSKAGSDAGSEESLFERFVERAQDDVDKLGGMLDDTVKMAVRLGSWPLWVITGINAAFSLLLLGGLVWLLY